MKKVILSIIGMIFFLGNAMNAMDTNNNFIENNPNTKNSSMERLADINSRTYNLIVYHNDCFQKTGISPFSDLTIQRIFKLCCYTVWSQDPYAEIYGETSTMADLTIIEKLRSNSERCKNFVSVCEGIRKQYDSRTMPVLIRPDSENDEYQKNFLSISDEIKKKEVEFARQLDRQMILQGIQANVSLYIQQQYKFSVDTLLPSFIARSIPTAKPISLKETRIKQIEKRKNARKK